MYNLLHPFTTTQAPRARNGLAIQPHATMGQAQCNAMLHGLNGLHGLTKHLLNMHITRASRAHHDHAIQQRSSTGLPSRCTICYTSSTGPQWACNSASYNNVTSSMQCNVTRAQRAPRAYQKAAKHACYTGFRGSKRISTAFINISHYICHNFGYTGQFWLKFRLIAVP